MLVSLLVSYPRSAVCGAVSLACRFLPDEIADRIDGCGGGR